MIHSIHVETLNMFCIHSIYIPLPDPAARLELFQLNLRTVQLDEEVSLEALAAGSDGHSGSDILTVCRYLC